MILLLYYITITSNLILIQVNPITKEEAKAVTTYKKVPILVADGVVVSTFSIY